MFHGKYCALDIRPPLPPKPFLKFDEELEELKNFSRKDTAISELAKNAFTYYVSPIRLGLCVPSGCSFQDIDQVGKFFGNYLFFDITTVRCEIKRENEFPPLVIFLLCVFGLLCFLTLIGSLVDLYHYYSKKRTFQSIPVQVLLAFSVISNFRNFKSTRISTDILSCLNGIKFLSMTWVILGHTYAYTHPWLYNDMISAKRILKDFFFEAVMNGTVSVDTFFCIGGLLSCYWTVKYVKEEGKPFDVKRYIFNRLWRMVPVYALVISCIFLTTLVGSGPLWHDMAEKQIQNCYKNWWMNMLFINNFYNSKHVCLPHSWYIACDMQLYVAALIVLIPLLRWPRIGISIAGTAVVICMVVSGMQTYLNHLPPTILMVYPSAEEKAEYFLKFYFMPYVHLSPYCIGLITGYLLVTKPKLQLSKSFLVVGWCLAVITNTSVLYGVFEWNSGRDPTLLETLLYSSLHKTAWTLGVAWMIICCATGHGGIINYILSWKIFIPLSRLTFVAYLVHPLVMSTFSGNLNAHLNAQHFVLVWHFFGHLCITYGVAFAGNMLVEAPFGCLKKIILSSGKKPDPLLMIQSNGNHAENLKIAKNGDLSTILPVDNGTIVGADNLSYVHKL